MRSLIGLKNMILTSMIALTLLTSVIAVGGTQNAYAGFFAELDCFVSPDSVDIELAAGQESDELLKVIDCDILEDIVFNIEFFDVPIKGVECPEEIEVNLSDPNIDPDSLSAEYVETIKVLEGTEPGIYHCDVEFDAFADGEIFFCALADGSILGPLNHEDFETCEEAGGNIFAEPVSFPSFSNLEQTIWITVPGDNDRPIGGTVGSMSTTSLLVAGAQANMGLWSLALVGIVGAGVAITYKLKSKKTEQ